MNRVLPVFKSPMSATLARTMSLVMGLLLGGCISPHSAPPKERALENPADLGLAGARAPVADAEWWTAYQDPQLDRLLRGALADNPTLAQSLARVRAAQAEAGPNDLIAISGSVFLAGELRSLLVPS